MVEKICSADYFVAKLLLQRCCLILFLSVGVCTASVAGCQVNTVIIIKSRQAFSFGEFTPRPGQFSSFNKAFDRYLGECYLSAEGRLLKSCFRKG